MQLFKEAWKKNSGLQWGLNPWPRDYRWCSTNWAMKPLMLGAGQWWVHMFPWKKWVLMMYEINHIWTAEMKWRWRNHHSEWICCLDTNPYCSTPFHFQSKKNNIFSRCWSMYKSWHNYFRLFTNKKIICFFLLSGLICYRNIRSGS